MQADSSDKAKPFIRSLVLVRAKHACARCPRRCRLNATHEFPAATRMEQRVFSSAREKMNKKGIHPYSEATQRS
jgi:hypothetical protein